MDITRYMNEQENPTPTADDPDHAQQMLRMAIRAASEVMTIKEIREYCEDYCARYAQAACDLVGMRRSS
jgi:hypothetical protein